MRYYACINLVFKILELFYTHLKERGNKRFTRKIAKLVLSIFLHKNKEEMSLTTLFIENNH